MATAENSAVKVTNNDVGPRYVHTARGAEVVPALGSIDTVMSAVQIKTAHSDLIGNTDDNMFDVEKIEAEKPKPAEKPLGEQTIVQLRKTAETEGVDLGDATAPADIVAKIEAKRVADAAK